MRVFVIGLLFSLMNVSYAQEVEKKSLSDLYFMFVQNDKYLSREKRLLDVAGSRYDEVKSEYYPQVYASIKNLKNNREQHEIEERYKSHEKSIVAQQKILDIALLNKINKYNFSKDKSYYDYRQKIDERYIGFIDLIFNYLLSLDEYEITQKEYKVVETNFQRIEEFWGRKLSTVIDLNEAAARKDVLEANLLEIEQKINFLKLSIEEMIGHKLSFEIEKPSRELCVVNEKFLKSGFAYSLENNYRIQSIRKNIASLESAVAEAKSEHAPTVSLQATIEKSNVGSAASRTSDYKNSTVGVNVYIPIFSGGSVNSRVKAAVDELEAEKDLLTLTEKEIDRELENIYKSLLIQYKKNTALKKALEYSEKARIASEASYEYKLVDIVALLNSIKNEFATSRDLKKSEYDIYMSYLRSKQLIGELDEKVIFAIGSCFD